MSFKTFFNIYLIINIILILFLQIIFIDNNLTPD